MTQATIPRDLADIFERALDRDRSGDNGFVTGRTLESERRGSYRRFHTKSWVQLVTDRIDFNHDDVRAEAIAPSAYLRHFGIVRVRADLWHAVY